MKIDAFVPDPYETPADAAFRMLETIMPQMVAFVDEAYKSTPEEYQAAQLRILYRGISLSASATQQLIIKLADRPMKLIAVATQIEAAQTAEDIGEARKALGAMRVQDQMFDAEVDELRERLITRADELAISGNLPIPFPVAARFEEKESRS